MKRETKCTILDFEDRLDMGISYWSTTHFQEKYCKKIHGIEVYEVKPWEVSIGDELCLRSEEVLKQLEEEGVIPCHWNEEMHHYIQKNHPVIVVDENMFKNINKNYSIVCYVSNGKELVETEQMTPIYWYISLPMLSFVKRGYSIPFEERLEKLPPLFNIREKSRDSKIIKEMISKVDKERFKRLLNILASSENSKRVVSDTIVDKYLKIWAESKYEFYLLFGKNLTVEQEIEKEMSETEMKFLVKELAEKHPKYGVYLNSFPISNYIKNEISDCRLNYTYETYGKQFFTGQGMKLSKFFSRFLQDKEFDLDLSKVMQSKIVKGCVYLSIDPYDYLTCAINKHDWESCLSIIDGEWGTGSASYLLDDTTIVSYRARKDTDYNYNIWGFKFTGNSKTYRQLIYFDKESCSIIFSRSYPLENEATAEQIRHTLYETIDKYLQIKSEWNLYSDYDGEFEESTDLIFSDIHNDHPFTYATMKDSRQGVAYWRIGRDIPCLCDCGENIIENDSSGVCKICKDR